MDMRNLKLLTIGAALVVATFLLAPRVEISPGDPQKSALEGPGENAPSPGHATARDGTAQALAKTPAAVAPFTGSKTPPDPDIPETVLSNAPSEPARDLRALPEPETDTAIAMNPDVDPDNADIPPYDGPATLEMVRDALRQRNFVVAAGMLSSPALADDAEAQYLLATLYRNGQGVAQDMKRAFALTKAAASTGHLEAEFSLGRMYLSGKGTDKDLQNAQLWMARAAEAGHVGATEALVVLITQMTAQAARPQPTAPVADVAASQIAKRLGKSPLLEAAGRGEMRVLSQLLEEGQPVDARDAEGRTPLMLAAENGHADIVEALLQAGAQPAATDKDEMTALMYAARNGQRAVIEAFLKARVPQDGQNAQGLNAQEISLISGHCATARLLVENAATPVSGFSPEILTKAIKSCKPAQFIELADAGIDLSFTDQRGRSGLWHGAQMGRPQIVEYYLKNGADPDSENAAGLSALLVAINGAQGKIAMDLIEAGAEIESATQSGNTPLLIAATRGLNDVARALIDKGADINHRNRDGFTALMLAAKYGRTEMVRTLVAENADIGLRNVRRERAVDIALAAGYRKIALLME